MQNIIEIVNGIPRHPLYRMNEPVNLTIAKGEQIAIVGPNGGGKSRLVDIITGRWPLLMNEVKYGFLKHKSDLVSDHIKYITFRDSYGDSDGNYYYQQRWNSQDMEITPIVAELLPETEDKEHKKTIFKLFEIEPLLNKHIVLLSSGELRKYQLAKTLLTKPDLLIMDNPFIGLDVKTRNMLQELLNRLIQLTDIQIIIVLSKTDDIPDFITHVIQVDHLICKPKQSLLEYQQIKEEYPSRILSDDKVKKIMSLPHHNNFSHEEIVHLNKVSIQYDDRVILKELDWTVMCGEKWALSGDNGAGKSTLLSLVCADNPQSYACDISLFGKKRGSGESIWEIKKHIGYVSPEMHRAYSKNIPAIDIVASGLHDTVGLYKRPRPEELDICMWWMDIFGILSLKDRNFMQLSSGEQRMVLLVRAFVKDPELLILDEPFHGLDMYNRQLVKDIIDVFCQRVNKTMIMVTHYQEELPDCITHHIHLKKN